MNPSRRRAATLLGAYALGILALSIVTGVPAAAQASSCPSGGLQLARVILDEPTGGTVQSPVHVRGRAEATLPLSRVELFVNGERAQVYEAPSPKPSLPFDLAWNAGDYTGSVSFRVVACGVGQVGGTLAWGQSVISVNVASAAPPPPPPAPPAVTTTVAVAVPAPAPPAAQNPAPTASAAPSRTGAGSGATAGLGRPATKELPADIITEPFPDADGDEQAAATATTVGSKPFVLTEGSDVKKPNRPLWVGVVVGLSGVAGLTFSAVFRWRRSGAPEEGDFADDTGDTELVQVG